MNTTARCCATTLPKYSTISCVGKRIQKMSTPYVGHVRCTLSHYAARFPSSTTERTAGTRVLVIDADKDRLFPSHPSSQPLFCSTVHMNMSFPHPHAWISILKHPYDDTWYNWMHHNLSLSEIDLSSHAFSRAQEAIPASYPYKTC